jgi:hypothetical protein
MNRLLKVLLCPHRNMVVMNLQFAVTVRPCYLRFIRMSVLWIKTIASHSKRVSAIG